MNHDTSYQSYVKSWLHSQLIHENIIITEIACNNKTGDILLQDFHTFPIMHNDRRPYQALKRHNHSTIFRHDTGHSSCHTRFGNPIFDHHVTSRRSPQWSLCNKSTPARPGFFYQGATGPMSLHSHSHVTGYVLYHIVSTYTDILMGWCKKDVTPVL